MSLDLVYADEWVLVFNKPAGLLSVPGRLPEHQDSLALRAQNAYPGALTVHRLDCATSGLMVMARDAESHRHVSRQFEQRRVGKVYEAVCAGLFEAATGCVELPLLVDWPNRPRSKVDWEGGKPATTQWQVLERYAATTRVALFPVTGRSHQLRIHTAEIGHPILGDPFYGTPESQAASPRLLLHARELTFFHPNDERPLAFRAACPF